MRETVAALIAISLTISVVAPEWAGSRFGEIAGRFVKSFGASFAEHR